MRDAREGGGFIGVVQRLEMIAHCDEDMALCGNGGALACEPGGEPAVESFLYQVAGCFMRRGARSSRAFCEEDDGGCEVAHAGDGEEERIHAKQEWEHTGENSMETGKEAEVFNGADSEVFVDDANVFL